MMESHEDAYRRVKAERTTPGNWFGVCLCPEPPPEGWFHRAPIECHPLRLGESLEHWRESRQRGRDEFMRRLDAGDWGWVVDQIDDALGGP